MELSFAYLVVSNHHHRMNKSSSPITNVTTHGDYLKFIHGVSKHKEMEEWTGHCLLCIISSATVVMEFGIIHPLAAISLTAKTTQTTGSVVLIACTLHGTKYS